MRFTTYEDKQITKNEKKEAKSYEEREIKPPAYMPVPPKEKKKADNAPRMRLTIIISLLEGPRNPQQNSSLPPTQSSYHSSQRRCGR